MSTPASLYERGGGLLEVIEAGKNGGGAGPDRELLLLGIDSSALWECAE
jgi:hypothetical protein